MKQIIIKAIEVSVIGLLIGIVVTLLTIAISSAGKNTSKLQDNLNTVDNMDIEQYDQTTKSGAEIRALVRLYKNKDYAVLVHVNGMDDETSYNNYGAVTTSASKNAKEVPTVTISDEDFNDNAINDLAISANEDTGELNRYTSLKNLSRKTRLNEYIRETARFDTRLVRDKNGQITGIAVRQQKTN